RGPRSGSGGRPRGRARSRSSTTPCSTSRCCSPRWRSTRSCSDGGGTPGDAPAGHDARGDRARCGARAEEHAARLDAPRALPAPVRRRLPRRLRLPLAELALPGIFITELAPADGRRLAVKDLFDTAGIRTTYGSAVFAEHEPEATAPAVASLQAAGWVNAGKTNLHEFAYGVTSQNLHYGTVPNPTYPGRTAGGSSGGSAAALTAGLAEAALGTDSGGSIRIPAACCGVVGFK